MDRTVQQFWEFVSAQLAKEYAGQAPNTWTNSQILDFLDKLEARLLQQMQNNPKVAARCGVKSVGGKNLVYQFRPMVASTFRRIFQYSGDQKSGGNTSTKNMFAIYLGYDSYEALVELNRLRGKQPINSIGKSFSRLIGRAQELEAILEVLISPIGNSIIGVDGMGGIGKTALCQEVVDSCVSQGLFQQYIWLSAIKPTLFREIQRSPTAMTLDSVVDHLMLELLPTHSPNLSLETRIRLLRSALSERPVLIILDNLDTAAEKQVRIISLLEQLLNGTLGKALLTSRRRFDERVFQLSLSGLDQHGRQGDLDNCVAFIRHEAKDKNKLHVGEADASILQKIGKRTGGSPKAMQLVVGQLGYRELNDVMGRLAMLDGLSMQNDQQEYIQFYRSIFFSSFELLPEGAVPLLLMMSHFVPYLGSTRQKIKSLYERFSKQKKEEELLRFDTSVDELWKMAFLERSIIGLNEVRFYLHPLTNNFIQSDLLKN